MTKPKTVKYDAAAAETTAKPATIQWRGLTLTVPPASTWPLEAFEASEDGKEIAAARTILGPEQWAQVKATAPTYVDFADLSVLIAGAGNGSDSLGESEASSDS